MSFELRECFQEDPLLLPWMVSLVKENVAEFYRLTSLGWDEHSKGEELAQAGMRYVVALDIHTGARIAFAAFIATSEPQSDQYMKRNHRKMERVLYCYELQVCATHRGKGVGVALMRELERIAFADGNVKRIVLTCFRRNVKAWNFYLQRLHYTVDYEEKDYGIFSLKPSL